MDEDKRFQPNSFGNLGAGQSPHHISNLSQTSVDRSTDSAIEEICPIHGDQFVAFNKKSDKLACNQCIYAEDPNSQIAFDPDTLEHINFTSYVASELKELFDEKF